MENPLRVINERAENLIDVREENKAYFWLRWIPRGKIMMTAVLALLVGGLIAFQFASRVKGKEVGHFIEARLLFDEWTGSGDGDSLEKLLALLGKSTLLKKSYVALMAQGLMANRDVSDSERFAKELFKKNEGLFPYEVRLGKISLLIGRGELASALEESLLLQREIREGSSASGTEGHRAVYAYNLVRIGMLAKELGMREWEKKLGKGSSLSERILPLAVNFAKRFIRGTLTSLLM